jgi:hypothetical protein
MENIETETEYPLRPRVMIDTRCTDFQEIVTKILSGDLHLNKSINKGITNRK